MVLVLHIVPIEGDERVFVGLRVGFFDLELPSNAFNQLQSIQGDHVTNITNLHHFNKLNTDKCIDLVIWYFSRETGPSVASRLPSRWRLCVGLCAETGREISSHQYINSMGQPLPYVCASPSCEAVRSSSGDGILFDVQQLFSKDVGTQPQVNIGMYTYMYINIRMSTCFANIKKPGMRAFPSCSCGPAVRHVKKRFSMPC